MGCIVGGRGGRGVGGAAARGAPAAARRATCATQVPILITYLTTNQCDVTYFAILHLDIIKLKQHFQNDICILF